MLSVKNLIVVAAVFGGAMMFSPEAPKQAVAQDRYWNNYWRWYDNDYSRYYNRRYQSNYSTYRNLDAYRYGGYRTDPYYGTYGNYGTYGSRYNYPYTSNYSGYYGRPRNSVNIGGLRVHWR
jgi:hypothetical protein